MPEAPAPLRLLDVGAVPPLRSQALYHGLGASLDETAPDTLVLCRPSAPYLSVGFSRRPAEELDLPWCRAAALPVIQREIGGGSVYLHPSQLFYQLVVHRRRAPFAVAAIYRRFLGPVVEALQALGLRAALAGVNEIEVDGRRIAGTGGGQIGEAMVVVGNVLRDFPVEVMGRAWRVPSEAFRRLAVEGLRRHLVTLDETLGPEAPQPEALGRRIAQAYARALDRPLVAGALTPAEEAAVRREERRLARLAPDGLAAPARPARLKLTGRAWVGEWTWPGAGGPARVTARIADGRIEALEVAGPLPPHEAARRVAGTLAERDGR